VQDRLIDLITAGTTPRGPGTHAVG
jgi:hypothetical protein